MKFVSRYIITLLLVLGSCKEQDIKTNAVARVYDVYLYEEDIQNKLPSNLSKEDSIVLRNGIINSWATEYLLLYKAKLNVDITDEAIQKLVTNYRKELLVDKYKQAVLRQELDTVLTDLDINTYYEQNKAIYKLNEDLIQLKYIHFSNELKDKDKVVKLFKSNQKKDINILIHKELEFKSFNFNDSIWIRYNRVEEKFPFLKEERKIKKNQFIQKEDSLGVYLVAVKSMLYRNDIAPKSYVIPTIKQMILHQRKLELIKEIEKTLVNDAINKKQFEQYK